MNAIRCDSCGKYADNAGGSERFTRTRGPEFPDGWFVIALSRGDDQEFADVCSYDCASEWTLAHKNGSA